MSGEVNTINSNSHFRALLFYSQNPSSSEMIHAVAKRASAALLSRSSSASDSLSSQLQQWRGIRVKARNNNLDQALTFLQRKMQASGIERMIKNEQVKHIKNSEKRVLAKKNLERKVRAQDLARKHKAILVQKVRGV